ncbi:isomerase [Amylibacter ulvae]|uniref:Isomerase n=1 Tax=Paramylibacter ulvae TaxID=1651968 RepID=A0ABQ3D1B1_9RHOB|nr:Gfo/Idh/MocA family oxidoreductase [Amylibacter ulvae]GHA50480.1 isomerase [Amylibacter ulvae]
MTFLVIGTGAIGKRHANNLSHLGQDVVSISMKSDGIDGLKQRLKSDNFEAAVLCTATQIRTEITEILAAHELPIYIEKPIAYRRVDLDLIMKQLGPLADRCFAGFMMRYHPAIRYLASADLDTYRFTFDIGHDVNQWRENWNFSDSYAANPDGGGVLLDLCHELDMAHTIMGALDLDSIGCLSHPDHVGVDFSTRIALHNENAHGTVCMDYLSPISTRKLVLWGQSQKITFDLANNIYQIETDAGIEQLTLDIDRQAMFQNAMADFIRLVRGEKLENPIAPILYSEMATCQLICAAYEQREFTGKLRSKT